MSPESADEQDEKIRKIIINVESDEAAGESRFTILQKFLDSTKNNIDVFKVLADIREKRKERLDPRTGTLAPPTTVIKLPESIHEKIIKSGKGETNYGAGSVSNSK